MKYHKKNLYCEDGARFVCRVEFGETEEGVLEVVYIKKAEGLIYQNKIIFLERGDKIVLNVLLEDENADAVLVKKSTW